MNKQNFMELPKVNHEFNFHAEIKYETENGFSFTSAVGNSYNDFLKDVKYRLKQYKDRQPKIMLAIKYPNHKNIDITKTILNETNRS